MLDQMLVLNAVIENTAAMLNTSLNTTVKNAAVENTAVENTAAILNTQLNTAVRDIY